MFSALAINLQAAPPPSILTPACPWAQPASPTDRSEDAGKLGRVSERSTDQAATTSFNPALIDALRPDEVPGVRTAWKLYRFMAYLVGTLLVVLVCVGLPLKYVGDNDSVVRFTGVPHGYLYMILVISAVVLGRKVHWTWGRLIMIALAGTVPFLSFVAEHYATKDVRAKIAAAQATETEPAAAPAP